MEALIIFVLGVLSLIVIVVWVGMTLAVLLAAIPAIIVAVVLVQIGVPEWAAILGSFLGWCYVVAEIEERRKAKRKQEEKR